MSPDKSILEPAIVALLREAAEWRLIGRLFECPDAGWQTEITALACEVEDPRLRAAVAASAAASPGLYHTTFGPGGPAAAREVSYHEDLLPGPALAELRGAYEAFAYRPSVTEPPDHVAIEAGFVAYLRVKEAYAQVRDDAGQRELCAAAARSFIDVHLSALAHPLADALSASGVEYLALAAESLRTRTGRPAGRAIQLSIAGQSDPGQEEEEMSCPS